MPSLREDFALEDEKDDFLNPPSILPYYLPLLLMLLEPLLGWSLGLVHWMAPKSWDFLHWTLRLGLFMAGLHVVLVGPIVQFAYPEIAKLKIPLLRVLALNLLLFPPLFSFGYYLGNVKHEASFFELFWDVFPLVATGALLFVKTRRTALLSMVLSLGLYLHFFLVGSLLGPFQTIFQWMPTGDSINPFRIVYGVFIFALAASLRVIEEPIEETELTDTGNFSEKVSDLSMAKQFSSVRERGIQFLLMMVLGLFFQFGLPFWVSGPESRMGFYVFSESSYLLFPIWILLSLNRAAWAQKTYLYSLYLGLFAFFYAFTTRALSGDSGLWNLLWLIFEGMALLTTFFTCLSIKNIKRVATKSSHRTYNKISTTR